MDENTNETQVEDEVIEEETPESELTPETDWEAEAKKARGIAQRALTKLKKLGEKEASRAPVAEKTETVKETPNSGELDATQLDYLDLKGITDDDEIAVVRAVVRKTGVTVREALKDDYVQAKIQAIRDDKAVKEATPGSTKRTGAGNTNDVAAATAKFEQTGELPEDFALRSAVVNAIADRNSVKAPSWHRK